MQIFVENCAPEDIKELRSLFLHESNFQFVCDKCHYYGWADDYLFRIDDQKVGYGSLWGTDDRNARDTIFEFFVLAPFRKFTNKIFEQFMLVPGITMVEAQSNDALLSQMLFEYCKKVVPEAVLFEEGFQTDLVVPEIVFRERNEADKMLDDDSPYVLDKQGEIVGSGGLMLNYNFPYADIYMQVKATARRQGLGAFLVQELKRVAYQIGRVPAARCNVDNHGSKATLPKAGLRVCGYRLKGHFAG